MITSSSSDFGMAHCHNVGMTMWYGQLRSEHVPLIKKDWDTLIRQSKGAIGICNVITQNAPMVAKEARDDLTRMYEGFGDTLKGVAMVAQGGGLKSSSIRLIMTTLTTLIKPPYPIKIFATIDEGATWLASQLNHAPEELREAMMSDFDAYSQSLTRSAAS